MLAIYVSVFESKNKSKNAFFLGKSLIEPRKLRSGPDSAEEQKRGFDSLYRSTNNQALALEVQETLTFPSIFTLRVAILREAWEKLKIAVRFETAGTIVPRMNRLSYSPFRLMNKSPPDLSPVLFFNAEGSTTVMWRTGKPPS